jgi:hypothetical protein
MNCDHHFLKAMQMLEDAKPPSGFRPQTPDEWLKLLRALEEMGYASLRASGLSDVEARELSHQTYGNPCNLLLLDLAFSEIEDVNPSDSSRSFPWEIK